MMAVREVLHYQMLIANCVVCAAGQFQLNCMPKLTKPDSSAHHTSV